MQITLIYQAETRIHETVLGASKVGGLDANARRI